MSTHDASLLPGLPFGTPFPNATGGSGVKCGRAPDSTGFNFTWESLNCVDTYKVDSQIFTTCVQGLRRAWQAGVRARGGGGGRTRWATGPHAGWQRVCQRVCWGRAAVPHLRAAGKHARA
jgi:hypothetical protein